MSKGTETAAQKKARLLAELAALPETATEEEAVEILDFTEDDEGLDLELEVPATEQMTSDEIPTLDEALAEELPDVDDEDDFAGIDYDARRKKLDTGGQTDDDELEDGNYVGTICEYTCRANPKYKKIYRLGFELTDGKHWSKRYLKSVPVQMDILFDDLMRLAQDDVPSSFSGGKNAEKLIGLKVKFAVVTKSGYQNTFINNK